MNFVFAFVVFSYCIVVPQWNAISHVLPVTSTFGETGGMVMCSPFNCQPLFCSPIVGDCHYCTLVATPACISDVLCFNGIHTYRQINCHDFF